MQGGEVAAPAPPAATQPPASPACMPPPPLRLRTPAAAGGGCTTSPVVPPPVPPPTPKPAKAKRQAGGLHSKLPKPKRQAGGLDAVPPAAEGAVPPPPLTRKGATKERPKRKFGGRGPGDGLLAGPLVRKDRPVYSYGNYDPYYHKRHDRFAVIDPRLEAVLKLRGPTYFADRLVLDMGCNSGFLTFLVAHLGAKHAIGVDIDMALIAQGLKHLRKLKKDKRESLPVASPEQLPATTSPLLGPGKSREEKYPLSMVRCQGILPYICKPFHPSNLPKPIKPSGSNATADSPTPRFPYNIEFRTENVLLSELEEKREMGMDIILCLKLTKWIHLNWGDDGVRALFFRCFCALKPGGELVLEAQDWTSYSNKKHLTKHSKEVRGELRLKPQDFVTYLTQVVGFEQPVSVGMCPPLKRPLLLLRKPGGPRPEPIQVQATPPNSSPSVVEHLSPLPGLQEAAQGPQADELQKVPGEASATSLAVAMEAPDSSSAGSTVPGVPPQAVTPAPATLVTSTDTASPAVGVRPNATPHASTLQDTSQSSGASPSVTHGAETVLDATSGTRQTEGPDAEGSDAKRRRKD